MFGDVNSSDHGMDLLGVELKRSVYDGMVTDEHTDERMEAMRQREQRTARKKKRLFSFLRRKKQE